jgi:hypothetical protein
MLTAIERRNEDLLRSLQFRIAVRAGGFRLHPACTYIRLAANRARTAGQARGLRRGLELAFPRYSGHPVKPPVLRAVALAGVPQT